MLVDPSVQINVPQTTSNNASEKIVPKMQTEHPPKRLKVIRSPDLSNIPKGITEAKSQAMGVSGHSNNKRVSIHKQTSNDTPINCRAGDGKSGSKVNVAEFRNFLITLLQDNPKGMTIKAVEKAVAEGMAVNADRRLTEKVIRSIASYHAPGKYMLNSGIEKELVLEVPVLSVGKSGERVKETVEECSSDMFKEVDKLEEKRPEEPENVISSYQTDCCSEKDVSALVINTALHDLKVNTEDSPRILDTKVPTPDGSDSSSSSEDGSESESESRSGSGSGSDSDSDSDSGSSGSGSASSVSESGSGSDSDSNSTSSGTSMDEDVDVNIMSDDEHDNYSELNQKANMKGVNLDLVNKEKVQDHLVEIEANGDMHKNVPLMTSSTVEHIDTGAKIYSMSGDEVFPSAHKYNSSGFPLETDQLENEGKDMKSSPWTLRNSEAKKRKDPDQSTLLTGVDSEEAEHLDILIDKICESSLHQQIDQKPQFSSMHIKSDDRADEVVKVEKKDQSGDNSSLVSSQSSLQARKGNMKDKIPRKGRTTNNEENNLKQVNTKLTRTTNANSRGHEIKEISKNTENISESKGRNTSPEGMVLEASHGRGIIGMHERFTVVNTPDHGVKKTKTERLRKDNGQLGKERVCQNKLQKSRASKALQSKQGSQKADGRIGIADSHQSRRDSGRLLRNNHDVQLQEPNPTKEDVRRSTGHELFEREETMEQHAERAEVDSEIWRMDKFPSEKDPLREESNANLHSHRAYSRDGQWSESTNSDSGWCSLKRNSNAGKALDGRPFSQDLELGEFREPLSENECNELTRQSSRTEIAENSKGFEEWTSLSARKLQPVHLDFSDSPKQSFVSMQVLKNDVRHDERTVDPLKIPKKRSMKDESRQPNYQTKNVSIKEWKVIKVQGSVKRKHTPQTLEIEGCEFFAPYEKREPEFRGPIFDSGQFRDYVQEFSEKYRVYARLDAFIELDKKDFIMHLENIKMAKCKGDKDKLENIYMEVRRVYQQCHKRCKRMRRTFKVLHEELQVIKRHCWEYVQNMGRR